MTMTKQKQTQRFKEQTSGYQWGERWQEEQEQGKWTKRYKLWYKINKIQGYNVQHKEYNQYNFKWNVIYKNIKSLLCIPETNISF